MWKKFLATSRRTSTALSGRASAPIENLPSLPHLATSRLSDRPNQRVISGGVICFSVEPTTQNIYVLLGREVSFENEPGVWCDFGGKLKPTESALRGAAREFAEESLGVIRLDRQSNGPSSDPIAEVTDVLARQEYFIRISIFTQKNRKVRVYFLKEIPWQPDIATKFANVRTALEENRWPNHPARATADGTLNPHWMEKQCLRWWSLDRLIEVLQKRGRFKHHRFRRSFLPALRVVVGKLAEFCL